MASSGGPEPGPCPALPRLSWDRARLSRAAAGDDPTIEPIADGLLADLLGATLVDAHEELRDADAALRPGRAIPTGRGSSASPRPGRPASVAKLRARPDPLPLLETLARRSPPIPTPAPGSSRAGPARAADRRRLLAELAGAAGGRLAREPRFRAWLRGEWTAWARQHYRRVAPGCAGEVRPVMIRVTLEGLVKRFDRVAVVDGASLEIRPGELTFLLGPSGAGKTTLARLVAGLEPPDEGEIYFDGRLVHALPPPDRRVGLVFQDDALWPHLTVAENVGYALKLRGVPRASAGAGGRDPRAARHRQPGRQAARRALGPPAPAGRAGPGPGGRARPADPRRAPGPAGDRVRGEFRDEIRRVHAETETTTLVLTADPREALALADRLAVIDLGRVVQSARRARSTTGRPTPSSRGSSARRT